MSNVSQCTACGTLTMLSYCPKCDAPTHLYAPQLRHQPSQPLLQQQQRHPQSFPILHCDPPQKSHVNMSPNHSSMCGGRSPSRILHRSDVMEEDTSKKALTLDELESLYRANQRRREEGVVSYALQEEMNAIKRERDAAAAERDDMERRLAKLHHQLEVERQQMMQSASDIRDLHESTEQVRRSDQEHLQSLRDENSTLRKENEMLVDALKEAQGEAIASKHQERIMQEALNNAKMAATVNDEELSHLHEQIDDLQQLLQLAKRAKEKVEDDAAAIEETLKKIEDDNEKLLRQNMQQAEETQYQMQHSAELQQSINEMLENESSAQKQSDAMQGEIQKLGKDVEQLRAENQTLSTEAEKLKEANACLSAENERLGGDVDHLGKDVEQLRAENQTLSTEAEKLKEANACLSAENERLGGDVNHLGKDVEQLRAEKKELCEVDNDLRRGNSNLRSVVEELSAVNSHLKDENGDLVLRMERLQGENMSLVSAKEQLEESKAAALDDIKKLCAENEKQREELIEASSTLSDLQVSLTSLQMREEHNLAALRGRNAVLEAEVSELKMIIGEARRAVNLEKKRVLDAVVDASKERERSAELGVLCDKLSSENRAADGEIGRLLRVVDEYETRLLVVGGHSRGGGKGVEREGYAVYPVAKNGRVSVNESGVPLGVYRD
ncbi:rhoptry protein [Trypanosoma grayi]|uniref:rhoptry protein n=1 Tax=Trypanosoma grayi TaxID=71804 RepID=UPI0004F4581C|nr:rhoptry protein [Trypanosoma grayi]KEG15579.1 rhoptry protein [Trypanosoma grayi]